MNASDIFDKISHPMRINILKVLAKNPMGFSELKRTFNISSSGQLDFHLKKLDDLIMVNENGNYDLTESGYSALKMLKMIRRQGWHKRSFLINIVVYILFNSYFLFLSFYGGINMEILVIYLPFILPIHTGWIIFYTYWTIVKRRVDFNTYQD